MAAEDGMDSRERIMEATYRALIEKGYADLTMSDIATRSETSTSLLHYHFDTKEDLLVAFLDHTIDRLAAGFADARDRDPTGRLHHLLSHYILDAEETERESFHIALAELRGQAPYNERYRERFERTDDLLTGELADILQEGMEEDVFGGAIDPEATASLIIAAADGARTKGIALGEHGYTRTVHEALYDHVLQAIFEEEAERRWGELAA